jgi:hypothetical protein
MPDVRAELIGGIVYMSSPQKIRHGYHHRKLARLGGCPKNEPAQLTKTSPAGVDFVWYKQAAARS